ncbi:hypothetical protein YW3DRAFT_00033 [Streptomyces sp. MnatMP-M77]|nr:hypothetical protein YW3DRAFT_00033 [Streptomyces sp. MnatMP-M77]
MPNVCELTLTQRTANRGPAMARGPVERGMARLKSSQIFRSSRISPNDLTVITKATLTLERQRQKRALIAAPQGHPIPFTDKW